MLVMKFDTNDFDDIQYAIEEYANLLACRKSIPETYGLRGSDEQYIWTAYHHPKEQ
jgi:hypothetical protein